MNQKNLIATSSADETIRIWDATTGRPIAVLEGHTNSVFSVRFSSSGRTLFSRANDGTIRIWRVGEWDTCSTVNSPVTIGYGGLDCSPTEPYVAYKTNQDHVLAIAGIDELALAEAAVSLETRHYVNARVVLAGDTGVGKSGLALVLTGKEFRPTESTHARHIWTMMSFEAEGPIGGSETREVLLWDLAGQPGYRLVHQLHLEEATVALIVFDSRSETDPLSGVFHWCKALDQAATRHHSPQIQRKS